MLETLRNVWSYQFVTFPNGTVLSLALITQILVLFGLGYAISRIIGFVMNKKLATSSKLGPDAIYFLSRLSYYLILIVVVLTALSLLQVPLTAFAFVTGAVAIGVGFGAQNIISNFISGWILMTERPIRIDDFIELGGMHGVIERIGNRSTRIRRVDGVHLLVPNSRLLEETVINWTLVDTAIRSDVRVGVAYGSDVRLVEKLIYRAVHEHDKIRSSPAPLVVFQDFGDNALVFDVFYWSDARGMREVRELQSDIRFRISELFLEHDITIAFPQRDIHIVSPIDPIPLIDQRGEAPE
jgi:small-conductance mechanosensitive channel